MKSKTLTIRTMVATDLQHLNVDTFGATVRGRTIELDGEPVGIGGVLHQTPRQAFSVMDDKLRKYPKTIVKFFKVFREMLENNYSTVYAIASETESNAPGTLKRMGFEFHSIDNEGREVYRWTQ